MPPKSSGDTEFAKLYEAELDYVWNSLRRLGVAPAHLEDVTHEVFMIAWKRFADYDRSRPVRPWLFGIAFRLASDFRNRASNRREVADEGIDAEDSSSSPDQHVANRQAQSLVAKALEKIPIDRRGVFIMHEIDERPIPEVAETIGIPLNTAYSRLRLARQDFAAAVEALKKGGSNAA